MNKARMKVARSALLTNRILSFGFRERFVRCYLWSVLLYACEIRTLKQNSIDRINAFLKRSSILRISSTSQTRNDTVLNKMGYEIQLLVTIRRKESKYLGRIQRGPLYALLKRILNRKIYSNKWINRKNYLDFITFNSGQS